MKTQALRIAIVVLLLGAIAQPQGVAAWESMGLGADLDRNEWAQQLCSNPFASFSPIVATNDPWSPAFASQRLQARDAEANTYWMWLREGGLSPVWQYSSVCAPFNTGTPGGSWFDNAEEANNNWYETQSVANSISPYCPAGVIGCTGLDYSLFGTVIRAADIVVVRDFPWGTVNQDTLRECLLPGISVETVTLHELGHAYGIAHNGDGVLALMNRFTQGKHNCNMTQVYSDQPWPDDMAAMQFKYGTIAGRHNLAVSAWAGSVASPAIFGGYRTGVGVDVDGTLSAASPTWTSTGPIPYTIEKYWDGTTPNTVFTRFVLVPIGTLPIFNWTSRTWSYPAGSSTRWMLDPTSAALPEGNTARAPTVTLQLSDVGVGTYRLFLEVDPSRLITETDEGDNVIPLNVVIRRI